MQSLVYCFDCDTFRDRSKEEYGEWLEVFNGDPLGPTFVSQYRCESCVIERETVKLQCGGEG
jgi:hypothetical protein